MKNKYSETITNEFSNILTRSKRSLMKLKIDRGAEFYDIGSASTVGTSTMGMINPGPGIIISSSTALLTSIAILITNENILKFKGRFTKVRDWINVITLLYEKTSKKSVVDKKTDEKESEKLKKI